MIKNTTNKIICAFFLLICSVGIFDIQRFLNIMLDFTLCWWYMQFFQIQNIKTKHLDLLSE